MDDFVEALFLKTPECLSKFSMERVNIPLPSHATVGSKDITLLIKCPCGNEHLYLEAARRKDLKGVCKKEEIISLIPPVYVGCTACKRFTLLFDPVIHGWKGEMNEVADTEDVIRLMKCAPSPGKVYVNYSYPAGEKISSLLATGIGNPEDYFDSFSVFFGDGSGGILRKILSYECG